MARTNGDRLDAEDALAILCVEPDPAPLRRGPNRSRRQVFDLHRRKILFATIHETADRGFLATSVGDIAQRARVSRRTFYEHFDGKEQAFLAAFDVAADGLRDHVSQAVEFQNPGPDRLLVAVQAYVGFVTCHRALTRALVFEVNRVGAGGAAHQARLTAWLTEMVRTASDVGSTGSGGSWELSDDLAVAVVGGLEALLRLWLGHGDGGRLLTGAGTLVRATLLEPAAAAAWAW